MPTVSLRGAWRALRRAGSGAPAPQWPVRHAAIVIAVACYLPLIALTSWETAVPVDLAVTYVLVIALLAVLSLSPRIHRSVRSTLAVGALLTANLALVESSGRPAVAHLGFAFVLVLVAFYQSWAIQAFATGYVTFYYLVLGTSAPHLVLNAGMAGDPSAPWPLVIWSTALMASVPAVAAWLVVARAADSTERLQVALAEAALRERSAAELNDTVMQDLVTCLYAAELGEKEASVAAARRAVESARRIVDALMTDLPADQVDDLDLVRDVPAQAPVGTVDRHE